MMDVFVINNENAITRFINRDNADLTIYEYENKIRALNAVESLKPSIIIVNYNIHKSATMELVTLLFKANLHSKIVLIAPRLSDDEVLNYLAASEVWVSRHLVSKLIARLQRQRMLIPI